MTVGALPRRDIDNVEDTTAQPRARWSRHDVGRL